MHWRTESSPIEYHGAGRRARSRGLLSALALRLPGRFGVADFPVLHANRCSESPRGFAAVVFLAYRRHAPTVAFFRQIYLSDATSTVDDVYSLGRWNVSADHGAIELKGAGPARVLSRPDRDVLIMRTSSDQEHRLTRDPGAPEFSATMRLSGMTQILGGDVSFTECLTGLEAPVIEGGDFPSFRHQVRSVGRLREPVYVEFEGRFDWTDDGAPQSVTIQRFITVRAETGC